MGPASTALGTSFRVLTLTATLIGLPLLATAAKADAVIYTWTDADGTMHIADRAPEEDASTTPADAHARDLKRNVLPEPPPMQERTTFTSTTRPLVPPTSPTPPPSVTATPVPVSPPAVPQAPPSLRDVSLLTNGYTQGGVPLGCQATLVQPQRVQTAASASAAANRQRRVRFVACPSADDNPALLLTKQAQARLKSNRTKAPRTTNQRLVDQARTGIDLMRPPVARRLGR